MGTITVSKKAPKTDELKITMPIRALSPLRVCAYDAVRDKLTGTERDTESCLDNFGARYDASSRGRFVTPDHAYPIRALPTPVLPLSLASAARPGLR